MSTPGQLLARPAFSPDRSRAGTALRHVDPSREKPRWYARYLQRLATEGDQNCATTPHISGTAVATAAAHTDACWHASIDAAALTVPRLRVTTCHVPFHTPRGLRPHLAHPSPNMFRMPVVNMTTLLARSPSLGLHNLAVSSRRPTLPLPGLRKRPHVAHSIGQRSTCSTRLHLQYSRCREDPLPARTSCNAQPLLLHFRARSSGDIK